MSRSDPAVLEPEDLPPIRIKSTPDDHLLASAGNGDGKSGKADTDPASLPTALPCARSTAHHLRLGAHSSTVALVRPAVVVLPKPA